MNKFKFLAGYLIAITALTLTVAMAKSPFVDAESQIGECKAGLISLDMKFDAFSKAPIERICVNENAYNQIKKNLLDEFETTKSDGDYDFDINNRELLFAVLNKEIKAKGGMSLEGANKQKIRDELINLLRNP